MKSHHILLACLSKTLILATTLIFSIPAFSQPASDDLISSAGKTESGANAIVSWSLGEVVVSSSQIHEGYQFPIEAKGLITAIEEQLTTGINLFPNPTSDIINLQIEGDQGHIEFELFNSNGQKIKETVRKTNNEVQLDFRDLKSGIYFLKVLESQKKSVSYKIIKK